MLYVLYKRSFTKDVRYRVSVTQTDFSVLASGSSLLASGQEPATSSKKPDILGLNQSENVFFARPSLDFNSSEVLCLEIVTDQFCSMRADHYFFR